MTDHAVLGIHVSVGWQSVVHVHMYEAQIGHLLNAVQCSSKLKLSRTYIEVVKAKDTVLDDCQILCGQLQVSAGVLGALRRGLG